MNDNKVSEKAIWEGTITPDNNDTPSWGSQMQSQPQMMFCYKCNNVIPGDSKYCPRCQIKLYVTCPKCGVEYSSQYPACNQCGTNREEYLRAQRIEQERKAAIERENRRQKEIAEQKRLEEERKRKKAEAEIERQKRMQMEVYCKENAEITRTKEYESTYSILSKAFQDYNKKRTINMGFIYVPLFTITIMFTLFCIHPVLGFILMIVLPFFSDNIIDEANLKKCRKHLQKYISSNNNHNNHLATPDLINMVSYQGKERLSDCCIIAYRKKYGLPINYEWHDLI
jgi:hypothetical protein